MEGEKILITEAFRGVLFENFPAVKIDEYGGYKYSMLDGLIAEEAAEEIPDDLKESVTVDFSTLNKKYKRKVKQELRSQIGMTREELRASEKRLLEAIFGVKP